MMVVAVLISNCHVSPNPNSGPDTAQPITNIRQAMKAHGLPVICAAADANWTKLFSILIGPWSLTPKAKAASPADSSEIDALSLSTYHCYQL